VAYEDFGTKIKTKMLRIAEKRLKQRTKQERNV
jgi:hypothetical protein